MKRTLFQGRELHAVIVSGNDARAARAAGCPVVLVSYGYNHGEPVASVDANSVIDRLDALALGWALPSLALEKQSSRPPHSSDSGG